jgi:uncharacterized protein (DUF2267 family)
MSTTGLEVFDTTVQKTNNWLNDLMVVLRWPDKHKVYLALKTTLQALRDRFIIAEVAHLGAQLLMLVRGFYYEGWDPPASRTKSATRSSFSRASRSSSRTTTASIRKRSRAPCSTCFRIA